VRLFSPLRLTSLLLAVQLVSSCTEEAIDHYPDRLVKVISYETSQNQVNLTYPGALEPRYQSQLAFQVGGRLNRRHVNLGDHVDIGQVIAALDTQDYHLGSTNLDNLKQAAAADYQRAKRDLRRARELVTGGFIGESQLDQAVNAEAAGKARLDAITAQHAESLNRLGYTEILSPQTGVITALHAEAGDILSPGQAVATLAWLAEWEFAASIPESHIGLLQPGSEVTINFWGLQTQPIQGRVREISPAADPGSRSYQVKISLAGAPEQLKLGMSGTINIPTTNTEAGALNTSAVISYNGGSAVLVVDPVSLIAQRRPITLGPPVGDRVSVTSGLTPGDLVVVAGSNQIADGESVRLLD